MTRELSPDLLPRDAAPIIWVPAYTWHCTFCEPNGGEGAGTTVEWLSNAEHAAVRGADGRCRECGQKYELAKYGEAVPKPEEQGWR